ncbi:hypothetical protein ATANTOWER_012227 [Ataeniobius toweri]|uniref:Uncharacterized protein n=1 Tax=Ataeniobius toweri TaxID=208326 RepID=A0ABU7C4K7_9TELE|nr:hypothetical protein [Ataeniobius toweri]
MILFCFILSVLVSGSSSSLSGFEPVSPTSPSTMSNLSSPLSSPSSPLYIFQPPLLLTPARNPSGLPPLPAPPLSRPRPLPPPTKIRTHSFCNHVVLRQLSNCNEPSCTPCP